MKAFATTQGACASVILASFLLWCAVPQIGRAQSRELTKADVDRLFTELSNTGKWARRDELGAWDSSKEGLAGLHVSCAKWLKERDVAMLGSDWEFLINAAPIPVEGGTGSPLNPIATF